MALYTGSPERTIKWADTRRRGGHPSAWRVPPSRVAWQRPVQRREPWLALVRYERGIRLQHLHRVTEAFVAPTSTQPTTGHSISELCCASSRRCRMGSHRSRTWGFLTVGRTSRPGQTLGPALRAPRDFFARRRRYRCGVQGRVEEADEPSPGSSGVASDGVHPAREPAAVVEDFYLSGQRPATAATLAEGQRSSPVALLGGQDGRGCTLGGRSRFAEVGSGVLSSYPPRRQDPRWPRTLLRPESCGQSLRLGVWTWTPSRPDYARCRHGLLPESPESGSDLRKCRWAIQDLNL
jgi:hypothetical protein